MCRWPVEAWEEKMLLLSYDNLPPLPPGPWGSLRHLPEGGEEACGGQVRQHLLASLRRLPLHRGGGFWDGPGVGVACVGGWLRGCRAGVNIGKRARARLRACMAQWELPWQLSQTIALLSNRQPPRCWSRRPGPPPKSTKANPEGVLPSPNQHLQLAQPPLGLGDAGPQLVQLVGLQAPFLQPVLQPLQRGLLPIPPVDHVVHGLRGRGEKAGTGVSQRGLRRGLTTVQSTPRCMCA